MRDPLSELGDLQRNDIDSALDVARGLILGGSWNPWVYEFIVSLQDSPTEASMAIDRLLSELGE